MIVDFDTKSLTFTFAEPSDTSDYDYLEPDYDPEETKEVKETQKGFQIIELSPCILQIMPEVQILRLRLDDQCKEEEYQKKCGMDDADIVRVSAHLSS